MTEEESPIRRMLDRPAELVDLGDTAGKLRWWWFKGVSEKAGAVHNFSLVQDGGNEIAAISTTIEPDDGSFRKGMQCRRTVVTFKDEAWTIITHAPRPQDEANARRFRTKRWRREDRIVEVVGASPGVDEGEQIAYLSNPSAWRILGSVEVTTADGLSVILAPQTVGRRFATGEKLTIKKITGGYRLTPKSPVPLEAVLLHWHVMLGDIRVPRPGDGRTTPAKASDRMASRQAQQRSEWGGKVAVAESSDRRRVYGRATSMSTGDPVGGLRVIAMDKDLLFDDLIGQAMTDEDGRYEIRYDVTQFRDLFERKPDIYLIVVEDDRVIGDTRDTLVREAGPDREMNVQVPERPDLPEAPTD